MQNRVKRDAIVLAAFFGSSLGLAGYFDAFDQFASFAGRHQLHGIEEVIAAIFLFGFGVMVFALRRLAELRDFEKHARILARVDELTGVPNRRRFLEELKGWKSDLGIGQTCVVLLVDLDRFKAINDLYGHRLGDEVLKATARRLKEIAGDRALVARIGGDEFALLMPVVSDHDAPRRVAEQIVYEIAQPIQLAALTVRVGVGVGVAFCEQAEKTILTEQDGDDIETVLRQADMALYQAKARGHSGYQFFCQALDQELRNKIELEREIDDALRSGLIVPYYQPLVDLRSGDVVGLEALVRWEHPRRGLLSPATIIPVAESTGTISDLTFSILRRAISDAKMWPSNLSIAVNLAPQLFSDAWLAQKILQVLSEASFPCRRLELEITETALIENKHQAKVAIESLRKLGVQIAIDDFGAGYSGLNYLHQFKLDRIKIDQSFVTDLASNRDSAKMARGIMDFSQMLGLKTTAEGIESDQVRKMLLRLGCDTGQGYLFSKPKPASEINRYLLAARGRRLESSAAVA
jgi:diguanylate cyclase (GGDEF)-like protein